ncbi:MAG: hypothetical protein CMJ47_12505 [Planctomyces sp.]|nr:hypothetical protein [Planctomyces sp.]
MDQSLFMLIIECVGFSWKAHIPLLTRRLLLIAGFASFLRAQLRALLDGSVKYDFSTVEHVIPINR